MDSINPDCRSRRFNINPDPNLKTNGNCAEFKFKIFSFVYSSVRHIVWETKEKNVRNQMFNVFYHLIFNKTVSESGCGSGKIYFC